MQPLTIVPSKSSDQPLSFYSTVESLQDYKNRQQEYIKIILPKVASDVLVLLQQVYGAVISEAKPLYDETKSLYQQRVNCTGDRNEKRAKTRAVTKTCEKLMHVLESQEYSTIDQSNFSSDINMLTDSCHKLYASCLTDFEYTHNGILWQHVPLILKTFEDMEHNFNDAVLQTKLLSCLNDNKVPEVFIFGDPWLPNRKNDDHSYQPFYESDLLLVTSPDGTSFPNYLQQHDWVATDNLTIM